jgi:hypothetical protein
MASDEEFETLKSRIEAQERHPGRERPAGSPAPDEIRAYLKVQRALVGDPRALSADELRAFQKVRDHLLATGLINGPIGACGGSQGLDAHGHTASPAERFSGLGK